MFALPPRMKSRFVANLTEEENIVQEFNNFLPVLDVAYRQFGRVLQTNTVNQKSNHPKNWTY